MTVRELIEKLEAMVADPDGPDILDRQAAIYDNEYGEVPLNTIEIATMSKQGKASVDLVVFSCQGDDQWPSWGTVRK